MYINQQLNFMVMKKIFIDLDRWLALALVHVVIGAIEKPHTPFN